KKNGHRESECPQKDAQTVSRYRSESRQLNMTVKTGYQPHPCWELRGFRGLASAGRPGRNQGKEGSL
ncbi:TPA: hypothetical protein ACPUFM_005480, partial [Klebsiella pneumoniae]